MFRITFASWLPSVTGVVGIMVDVNVPRHGKCVKNRSTRCSEHRSTRCSEKSEVDTPANHLAQPRYPEL
jgi:hypothetical protein